MTGSMTVRTTQDFEDDLAVLCSAVQPNGKTMNKTEAVKQAVQRLADAYKSGWDYGDVQEGFAPVLLSYRYRMDNGEPSWVPAVPHLNITEREIKNGR